MEQDLIRESYDVSKSRIQEILTEEIAAAYAKLNYAVNTARCGAEGLDTMEDDELVAYPVKELPF